MDRSALFALTVVQKAICILLTVNKCIFKAKIKVPIEGEYF